MTVELVKLSVCDCGFPALDEKIPLGTTYDVDFADRPQFTWICGGCGKTQSLEGVFLYKRADRAAGYLPSQLFKPL